MKNNESSSPGKCPHCKGEVSLRTVNKEIIGAGFIKQEIMYACPHCRSVLGFSRGKFMS